MTMTDESKHEQETQEPSMPNQGLALVGTPSNVSNREDIPPDGGYGWVCTICFFLINANTWGVNSVGRIVS